MNQQADTQADVRLLVLGFRAKLFRSSEAYMPHSYQIQLIDDRWHSRKQKQQDRRQKSLHRSIETSRRLSLRESEKVFPFPSPLIKVIAVFLLGLLDQLERNG